MKCHLPAPDPRVLASLRSSALIFVGLVLGTVICASVRLRSMPEEWRSAASPERREDPRVRRRQMALHRRLFLQAIPA